MTRLCASVVTGPGEHGSTPATRLLHRGTEPGGTPLLLLFWIFGCGRRHSTGLEIPATKGWRPVATGVDGV
uniref:Uncharacterized protein n=1 Tax=Arundo donax TaxID=35708 RepID=A0A0A9APE8_ARUDO